MESNCKKKILSSTLNGKVMKCESCNRYHIEYNNLLFTFTSSEFQYFRKYFLELDAEYWGNKNVNSGYSRKIIIPVGHKNVSAIFNKEEINELKALFTAKKKEKIGIDRESLINNICIN